MKKETTVYRLEDIPVVAKYLKKLLEACQVMTFTGPLGAGKTTLVKELLAQSGVTDLITSPTFAYVNQYQNKEGITYHHFDLYRIDSVDAFRAAGFDEYLYAPESRCLIEWPAPIMPLLAENSCHITIDYHDDPDKRTLTIEGADNE